MKTQYRIALLILLLVAAVFCYVVGFQSGMWGLIGLGLTLELAFWVGLLNPPTSRNDNAR